MSVTRGVSRIAAFLFFLGGFIVPINVSAKDSFSIGPGQELAETSRSGLEKNIKIFDDPPYIQPLPVAELNLRHLVLRNKIVNYASYIHSLMRTKERTADRCSGERKVKLIGQGERQNGGCGAESYLVSWCIADVKHHCLGGKFDIVGLDLICSRADLDTNISSQLHSAAFGEGFRALNGRLGAYFKMCSDLFHCDSRPRGLLNGTLHIFGLFGGGTYRSPQLDGLITEYEQLKQSDSADYPSGCYQIPSELNQFPVIRRFIIAVFGLLNGFFVSLYGWQLLYDKRVLFGATLLGVGWLLGALGLVLLILTDYPSTWGWIL
jgi:hypothetical protein